MRDYNYKSQQKVIENFDALRYCENLKNLIIDNIKVSNASSIPNLEKLEELEITDESIKDISKLPELQSIKKLSLSNNNISDITPLNKFDFKNLQLNNNKIYDCSGLELYYHNDFGYFELQDRLDIQYQDVKLPDIT